ncbi:MAG TPA: tetratricopeptide repeat protein [Gemmatimonadales bacterium]|nr:tetratricopeptide repeat protein [Gemmatimonadales bacterium]
MRSTGQYHLFATEPGARRLQRARMLAHEGRTRDAEHAYRAAVAEDPADRSAWGELFEFLRTARRHPEALSTAEHAAAQFPGEAFPLALVGAAHVELGQWSEGLDWIQKAIALDPDLALAWHEAGYAAWRAGEHAQALMAVDRAFALDPHGATLELRGRILRDAGRYLAAEVSFSAAAEAAEYGDQRREAERQLAVTRRYAAFHGSRPAALPVHRRWFAETGGACLTAANGEPPPSDGALVQAFVELAHEEGWAFTRLVTADDWPGWAPLKGLVTAQGPGDRTLVAAHTTSDACSPCREVMAGIAETGRGLSFALAAPFDAGSPVDVVGRIGEAGGGRVDLGGACEMARHPESRLARRILR